MAEKIGDKWGESVNRGWTAIPNDLLRHQSKLGLDSTDLNLLLNLIRFWWLDDQPPFPSAQKTADEMGVNVRTVYRRLASLEERDFLSFVDSPKGTRAYSLKKLVEKINSL